MISEDEMQDRLVRIAALAAAVQTVQINDGAEDILHRASKFATWIEKGGDGIHPPEEPG